MTDAGAAVTGVIKVPLSSSIRLSILRCDCKEIQLLKVSNSNVIHYVLISTQIIRIVLQASDHCFELKCCKTQQRTLFIRLILFRNAEKRCQLSSDAQAVPEFGPVQ